MGSFNTLCAVSKTPILVGQKVRVFFLVMNSFPIHYSMRRKGLFDNIYMGSKCYPYDNFKILGYPLLAEYSDYGSYDFIDEDMSNLMLKKINKIYIPNRIQEGKEESDYNEYHDYLNIEKLESMDQVQEIEFSGALRVKTPHGVSALAKMAIHEEIYQELIIKGKIEGVKSYDDENLYLFEEHINYLKDMVDNSDKIDTEDSFHVEFVEERLEELKKDLNSNEEKKDKDGNIITKEKIQENINKSQNSLLREKFRCLFGSSTDHRWLSSSRICDDLVDNNFKDKIIEGWCSSYWTNIYFENNNLEFAPVITSGQCYDYKENALNFRGMANIIEGFESHWDSERLSTEVEFVKKVTLSMSGMKEKIEDWFNKKDEAYKNYKTVVNELKEKEITSYIVGDESNFDLFAENYELIDEEKGTKIHFKFDL